MRLNLPNGTRAELAKAPSGTPTRGLVIIPDIGSLRPLFDSMCERVAREQNWNVCAFDLWPFDGHQPLEWRLDHVGDLEDERVLGDAALAADATGVDDVAVIGFCMGGMYTLKAAGTGRFKRAAAFYGMIRIPDRWKSKTQGEPLEALSSPQRCPTMAVIGTADPWTPRADVDALEVAGVEVLRYEGADHGFVHDPDRPAHRAGDAADAWGKVMAFLSEP